MLACLLVAVVLLPASPVMAQFVRSNGDISSSGRGRQISEPVEEPAEPGGQRFRRAKEPVPKAEREYEVVHRPVEDSGLGHGEGWLPDEAPSAWREEAEYADSAPEPDRGGILENEEAVQRLFGKEEEITVEWVEEGEDVREAYPAPAPRAAVDRSEESKDFATVEADNLPTHEPEDFGHQRAEESEETFRTRADLLVFPGRVARDVSLNLSPDSYGFPDELMAPHWTQCLAVLEDGTTASLQSSLNGLYEAKLDAGFRNMPDYATLLIRRAYGLLEAGSFLEARLLGEAAYNLAPEYYPVSSSLSRLVGKDPQRGAGNSLRWTWVSLKQRFQDFLWQFTTVGRVYALVMMTLYLSFLALGFYFLSRYARVLLHFVYERLPVGQIGMTAVGAVLLATLLVLLFLPGPFWVTVFVGFLTGRFARRWEKICFSVFLLVWALSPWLFNQTVCFFSPLSDATRSIQRCIQGEWNAASEEALNAAVEAHPESLDLQLTKALVEKRRGNYEQAERVLRGALLTHPHTAGLWNNLGNLYAIQGNMEQAKAAYRKAIMYGNGSAAPHYNLSQLLRREFSFLKGAQAYQSARRLDAERVDYFTYIHSPSPNRFFMDEEPRKIALWRHAFYHGPETERAAENVWRSTAAGIPLRQAPWVFLSLLGVYVVFVRRRRSGQEPFACSGCGKVVCGKCDKGAEVGGLCSPCYQALYQRENISKERRHGQIRKMARHQSKRSRRLLILNLLLPGLGYSLLEERPRGMFVLLGLLFLVLFAGFWSNMLPVPMTVWETGGSFLWVLSVPLLICLYIVIQKKFMMKIRARR